MEKRDNILPDYESFFKGEGKKKKTKFISKVLRKNSRSLFVSLIIYVIKASPLYIIPLLTADIINVVTYKENFENPTMNILIDGAIIAFLLIQNIPMNALYHRISDKMLRRTSAGVRSSVVRKLQRLSISYHKELESGKVQAKFIKDVESVDMLMNNVVKNVITTIINLIISIVISVYKSGIITVFFIVVIPFNVALTQIFRKRIRKNNRNYRRELENVSSQMSTMLEMIQVTKAHGLEEQEVMMMDTEIEDLKGKGLKVDNTNAFFNSFGWCLSNFLSCSCLILTSYLCLKGEMGIRVGDVVLYQSLFAQINGSIQGLINMLPQMSQGVESISSLNEVMKSEDVEDNRNKQKVSDLKGNIRFENVSYRYPNTEDYVVKNFNLDVKEGECIAIVGSSGSGKTTIINMIIGFLLANSGNVFVDSKNIKDINLCDYRHFISVVPQNAILFTGTIKENITYRLSCFSDEDIDRVVKQANLKEFIDSLPDGLNTVLKEHASNLSGGQRQRITIARALIRNPRIIIFDEATSALDSISEYYVQQAISESIKGRTTFIVAHRLSTIRNADRIVVMENGVAVEIGTYDELMAKQGRFYNLKLLNDASFKKALEDNETIE